MTGGSHAEGGSTNASRMDRRGDRSTCVRHGLRDRIGSSVSDSRLNAAVRSSPGSASTANLPAMSRRPPACTAPPSTACAHAMTPAAGAHWATNLRCPTTNPDASRRQPKRRSSTHACPAATDRFAWPGCWVCRRPRSPRSCAARACRACHAHPEPPPAAMNARHQASLHAPASAAGSPRLGAGWCPHDPPLLQVGAPFCRF